MDPLRNNNPFVVIWAGEGLTTDDVAARLGAMTTQERDMIEHLAIPDNNMDRIPNQILELGNLRVLDICCNQLTCIPPQIGNLQKLQHLSLWRNKLKSLPPTLTKLKELVLLCLSWNPKPLPSQFAINAEDKSKTQLLLKEIGEYYSVEGARAACRGLLGIRRFRESALSPLLRELVGLVARNLWETRHDKAWIAASATQNAKAL